MAKHIKATLSQSSLRKAQQEIQRYRQELIQKTQTFVQRLADEGVILAKVKISQYPAVHTGELLNSIMDEPGAVITNGSQWIIYTGCEWAQFVEFGTGITGSQNPHPDTGIANWKYDVNEHGDTGWWYYKEGEWHWTKGMPSRPFMYETAKDLADLVPKIAKEVFGK